MLMITVTGGMCRGTHFRLRAFLVNKVSFIEPQTTGTRRRC
jgi:hypothetical protein